MTHTQPTFNEIFNLPEPEKSIFLTETTLMWDIEMWEQYVHSEENGEIEGSNPTDLQDYKDELAKAIKEYQNHKSKYAEYFI